MIASNSVKANLIPSSNSLAAALMLQRRAKTAAAYSKIQRSQLRKIKKCHLVLYYLHNSGQPRATLKDILYFRLIKLVKIVK